MYSFKQYLNEAKNTHLEHLEDEIINNGYQGGLNAVEFLKSLRNMLTGSSRRKLNVFEIGHHSSGITVCALCISYV